MTTGTDTTMQKEKIVMKKTTLLLALLTVLLLTSPTATWARIKIQIDKDLDLELGFRLQTQFLTSTNALADEQEDHEERFLLRRARIRLGGRVTKWITFFMQVGSDSEEDGSVGDAQVMDGFIHLHLLGAAQIIMGEHMAPAGRQHLTSSAAMMAIDRPGITNYNLTWGLNGGAVFNTVAFDDGNLDLTGDGNLQRDIGATLFGSVSYNENVHLKYYVGGYTGIQFMNNSEDKERITGRVQFNFLDPEPGYYNLSTYLGAKKTIAIGGSIDHQQRIAQDTITGDNVNYLWYSLDAFTDFPVGPGSVNFEAGFNKLDLENSTSLRDSTADPPKNAKETAGSGFYVQTGYYLKDLRFQPWALYERWYSDASGDVGSWSAWRIGLSYFVKNHNANIKVGFEQLRSERRIGGISDDKNIESFLVGFYLNY
jgi:hypothetical protein